MTDRQDGQKPVPASSTSEPPGADLAKRMMQAQDLDTDYLTRSGAVKMPEVKAAIELLESESRKTIELMEPKMDGTITRAIVDHLLTIGARINPSQSTDQATLWAKAVLQGYRTTPRFILLKAVRQMVDHEAFRFVAEVDVKLRELVNDGTEALDRAQRRCKAMRDQIIAAWKGTQKFLPLNDGDSYAKGKVLTDQQIHDLQRKPDPYGLIAQVLRLGISLGYVERDQLLSEEEQL